MFVAMASSFITRLSARPLLEISWARASATCAAVISFILGRRDVTPLAICPKALAKIPINIVTGPRTAINVPKEKIMFCVLSSRELKALRTLFRASLTEFPTRRKASPIFASSTLSSALSLSLIPESELFT